MSHPLLGAVYYRAVVGVFCKRRVRAIRAQEEDGEAAGMREGRGERGWVGWGHRQPEGDTCRRQEREEGKEEENSEERRARCKWKGDKKSKRLRGGKWIKRGTCRTGRRTHKVEEKEVECLFLLHPRVRSENCPYERYKCNLFR